MELIVAVIGLVTAVIGAWTAYANRPAKVAATSGPGPWAPPTPYPGRLPGQDQSRSHNPYVGQSPDATYQGFGGSIARSAGPYAGQPHRPDQAPPQHPAFPSPAPHQAPPGQPPSGSAVRRRYRTGTAIRDAGLVFAASTVAGFVLGLTTPDSPDLIAILATTGLVIQLAGFTVAGILAGADRWRHLLVMGLVVWVLNLVNVAIGYNDLGTWFLSVIVQALVIGLTGLIATFVHRLRTA